jgi:hypothetical protein
VLLSEPALRTRWRGLASLVVADQKTVKVIGPADHVVSLSEYDGAIRSQGPSKAEWRSGDPLVRQIGTNLGIFCDAHHSSLDDLLLYSNRTVVPGGAPPWGR